MKRSEINQLIKLSKEFFNQMNFKLPPWAFWKPDDWKGKYETCSEIADNMLGWDLTDFGSGDFHRYGLILFTIRNGNIRKDKKPYAEKIMIVEEMQETPTHFHWSKMEDIINRGGGNLVIELWNSTPEEELSNEPFTVKTDGVLRKLLPGDKIILTPGESICLTQGLYHRFYGEAGKGKVLVGEVSAVNDDNTDNRFNPPVGRFPEIEEDEAPLHLLVSDYHKYF
ncbi:MAG TPA: D-lyxose/D-mannose family sugar isomerase [Draconibacterium sp.]|jgi:D-lyxose ketol-isomerase|nr:D-lyxose/D-mannose family sugar isomerase [Draconibacterium sp.]